MTFRHKKKKDLLDYTSENMEDLPNTLHGINKQFLHGPVSKVIA